MATLSLSMLTTIDPLGTLPFVQVTSGEILTVVALTGLLEQILQGPVYIVVNLVGMPGLLLGVNRNTFVPGRKSFLCWWYNLRCLRTSLAKFSLTNSCALSMRRLSLCA